VRRVQVVHTGQLLFRAVQARRASRELADGLSVVGEAKIGEEADAAYRKYRPPVVPLDLQLPDRSIATVAAESREADPEAPRQPHPFETRGARPRPGHRRGDPPRDRQGAGVTTEVTRRPMYH
jgi:hypothetical protein